MVTQIYQTLPKNVGINRNEELDVLKTNLFCIHVKWSDVGRSKEWLEGGGKVGLLICCLGNKPRCCLICSLSTDSVSHHIWTHRFLQSVSFWMTPSYDLHKQRVETLHCMSSIPPPSVWSDEAADGFTSVAVYLHGTQHPLQIHSR